MLHKRKAYRIKIYRIIIDRATRISGVIRCHKRAPQKIARREARRVVTACPLLYLSQAAISPSQDTCAVTKSALLPPPLEQLALRDDAGAADKVCCVAMARRVSLKATTRFAMFFPFSSLP